MSPDDLDRLAILLEADYTEDETIQAAARALMRAASYIKVLERVDTEARALMAGRAKHGEPTREALADVEQWRIDNDNHKEAEQCAA